jgi:putative ATPase
LGEHLHAVRDRLFEVAALKRNHLVLDAHAASGLLTWEALRRARDGGVWCLAANEAEAVRLRRELASFAERTPDAPPALVIAGPIEALPKLIEAEAQGDVRFDRILGRGILGRGALPRGPDRAARIAILAALLSREGRLVIAEPVPSRSERILAALDWKGFDADLARRVLEAESALYEDPANPQVNWDERDLLRWCESAGLKVTHRELWRRRVGMSVSAEEIARWFESGALVPDGKLGGDSKLGAKLGSDAPLVRRFLEQRLAGQTLTRQLAVAFVVGERT